MKTSKIKQLSNFKRVASNISLKSTNSFKIRDFFKTNDNGGIFIYVNDDIFQWFNHEVKNSPVKELASYEFIKDITEQKIFGDARTVGIYEEVDFAHIKQICERHITKGERLLKDNGRANLFWVRDKIGTLREVNVHWITDGWRVFVHGFIPSRGWYAGDISFFHN